jgi:GrpB-like predicted nucleotidyltransferase (UPF0157 family)
MSDAPPPDVVELTAYSPMWPAVFDIEKGRLTEIFGADTVTIEHIGSTSVPGMGGKPIIDILLGAPALAVVEAHIPGLVESGYRHVPELERSMPNRRYFVKLQGNPGRFNLHAVVQDTPYWKDHLAFRDVLRDDPGLAERYFRLKKNVAVRYRTDRGAQADALGEFIRSAIARRR